MKEQIINIDTARLAKEKGFRNPYASSYWEGEPADMTPMYIFPEDEEKYLKYDRLFAPTQSLLQRWLREKHKINMMLEPYPEYYWILIWRWGEGDELLGAPDVTGDTYEIALERALQEALKLIK